MVALVVSFSSGFDEQLGESNVVLTVPSILLETFAVMLNCANSVILTMSAPGQSDACTFGTFLSWESWSLAF